MSGHVITGWPAIVLAFAGAVGITWYYLPKVIKIAAHMNLTDHPGSHKIHKGDIPTLGGIGIFAGFIFGFLLGVNGYMHNVSYFTAAALILFFMGAKDDMVNINAWKKFAAEVTTALVIAFFTDIHFTTFHGFLGVGELPVWASILSTAFVIVLIINAVNLIDGVDGLAASVGIIASLFFGTWFILSGDYGYTIMAVALLGSLIVFFFYNISNGPRKIFMGDTGSLVIGFVLAVMAIRFNEINATASTIIDLRSAPAVSIAVLIIPLFDTLRVVLLRLHNHQHPFAADNRHMHHLMLRMGFTHRRTTLYTVLFNVFIIGVALLADGLGILWLGLLLLAICSTASFILERIVRKREAEVVAVKEIGSISGSV